MIKFSITVFICTILFACSKEEEQEPKNQNVAFEFISLTTDRDTINAEETATITASATGNSLEYHWKVSAGDIIGSGSTITYAASPCQAGNNIIECTVKDGNNNSATKKLSIFVK